MKTVFLDFLNFALCMDMLNEDFFDHHSCSIFNHCTLRKYFVKRKKYNIPLYGMKSKHPVTWSHVSLLHSQIYWHLSPNDGKGHSLQIG